uniref:Uncharacterized protein n=1 Tax=Gasterosteus aculeatus TaxID=69293 RepID=G3P3K1_GASAC
MAVTVHVALQPDRGARLPIQDPPGVKSVTGPHLNVRQRLIQDLLDDRLFLGHSGLFNSSA